VVSFFLLSVLLFDVLFLGVYTKYQDGFESAEM